MNNRSPDNAMPGTQKEQSLSSPQQKPVVWNWNIFSWRNY